MPLRDRTIGDRIAKARKASGLNPAELARLIGVKPQAIYMLEGGKVNSPTPENLFRIADALGVNPRMLVFGDRPGETAKAVEPDSRYSVEQVFDEETLLFARRFQALDPAQRRDWMLSLLLTLQPQRRQLGISQPAVPLALAHPPPRKKS